MSKHYREEFERKGTVIDLATGAIQSNEVPSRKAQDYDWIPAVHGHSPQGRSDAAKLGWERRRAKAQGAMLGVPGADKP